MDERAVRGVPWTVLTYAGAKGLSLASTLVLARLLVPADFGVVAVASTIVLLLSLIQDLGIANTLILRPDLAPRAQGTVLSLMLVTGLALAVAGALFAPAAAAFFDEPRLRGVLAALMVNVAVASLWSFHQTLLQRELEFRKRFAAHLVMAGLYAAVSVSLAFAGAGVWSMVIGQIVSTVAGTGAMIAFAAPYRVAPAWDPSAAVDAVRGGAGFLAQSALYFVQQNADYLIIGRLLQSRQLGFYFASFRLAEVPVLGIAAPVAAVTFPAFAAMRARGEDIRPAFLSVLRLIAFVACPIGVILSATSGPFTEAILGDKWLPVVPVLTVLGLWAALRSVQSTTAWLLNSAGVPGLVVRVNAVLLLPLLGAVTLAATHGGIASVAAVVLAHTAASAAWIAGYASSRLALPIRRQWSAVRTVAIACAVSWIAARTVVWAVVASPAVTLVLGVLAGTGAYALSATALERGLVRDAYRQIRRTLPGAARVGAAGTDRDPTAGDAALPH